VFKLFGWRAKPGVLAQQKDDEPQGPHGERRRGFFVFTDDRGTEHVLDPFLVFRQLAHDPKINLEKHTVAADHGEEPETTELIEFICRVFGVVRYSPQTQLGMSDWEILGVLGQFHEYLEGLKKNIDTGSTSLEPTESSASGASPERPTQQTAGSLSPSTPNGSESTAGGPGGSSG
jgi:hypothetical protein